MGKTSKIFYGLIGVLLVVIAGLLLAINQQRQATKSFRLKEQLELDNRRMELVSDKAKLVTDQVPLLRERVAALEVRWQQVQGRLYHPATDKADLESALKLQAKAAQLELVGVEEGSVEDQGSFREHVYHVRMSGIMTNLPAWADTFFRQRRIARLDRVSVVSPDLQFQKVKLKATVRFYEPKDPAQLTPGAVALDKFDVPLTYVSDQDQVSDPMYGKALEVARQKATVLTGLKTNLVEASKLEKQIAGLEKLLAGTKNLEDMLKNNRSTALQNLPTLYIRVRNSPVGSAALLLTGNDAKFPELAGDE